MTMASSRMRCSSSRSTISLSARRMPRSAMSASFGSACLDCGDDSVRRARWQGLGEARLAPARASPRAGSWMAGGAEADVALGPSGRRSPCLRPASSSRRDEVHRAVGRRQVQLTDGVLAERGDPREHLVGAPQGHSGTMWPLHRPHPAARVIREQVPALKRRDGAAAVHVAAYHGLSVGVAVLSPRPDERGAIDLGGASGVVHVRALVPAPSEVGARRALRSQKVALLPFVLTDIAYP